jgi:hypothetical protein
MFSHGHREQYDVHQIVSEWSQQVSKHLHHSVRNKQSSSELGHPRRGCQGCVLLEMATWIVRPYPRIPVSRHLLLSCRVQYAKENRASPAHHLAQTAFPLLVTDRSRKCMLETKEVFPLTVHGSEARHRWSRNRAHNTMWFVPLGCLKKPGTTRIQVLFLGEGSHYQAGHCSHVGFFHDRTAFFGRVRI